MKLCIIANKDNKVALYLYEEAKKIKEISNNILVSIEKLYIEGNEKIVYRDKDITDYDFCILHIPCNTFPLSYLTTCILNNKKVILSHEPRAFFYLSSRVLMIKAFERAKVNYPKTYLAMAPEVSKNIVNKFDKLVFKLADVHGGKGIVVVKEKSTANGVIDAMHTSSRSFCMQEVIEGEVIKLLIVGEEVIGIKEVPKPGEDRSNIAQSRRYFRPSDKLIKIGRKVAKEIGALCCEVDIIEKGDKYYTIDISINPNLLMYRDLSGKNVANILLRSLLEKKEKMKAIWERKLWKKLSRLLPLPIQERV
ncbi:MAG: hypothetical protein B6U88_00460 [Candidatus Aenigmarchaeota archaeon ex4484_56]|nr:MAG: hypothetical protein B6U88_00460 [Candidatus Aenigmarchaeota archaeon ex4484_56]